MQRSAIRELLAEFDSRRRLLTDFSQRVESLIRDLLPAARVQIQSITSRVKDRESLERKLGGPGRTYDCLDEVTDLVGLRVITYFAGDVEAVCEMIEREFQLDRANSVDKGKHLDPDRFGYLSVHYIVSLDKSRAALTEYRGFAGLKAEIQIRSVLQHAWAEIEHDLGYKGTVDVPAPVRRRFSQLAGLLELADDQFGRIRSELDEYSRWVSANLKQGSSSIPIDGASLPLFMRHNQLVREVESAICEGNDLELVTDSPHISAREYRVMQQLGLETLADVEVELRRFRPTILAYAAQLFGREHRCSSCGTTEFISGTSIGYLLRFLAYAKGGTLLLCELSERIGLRRPPSSETLEEIERAARTHPPLPGPRTSAPKRSESGDREVRSARQDSRAAPMSSTPTPRPARTDSERGS